MNRLLILLEFLVAAICADSANADGLIYQLPKDGMGVTYQIETKQTVRGRESATKGTLSLRSVGQATVDGENCRWIECKSAFKLGTRDQFDQVAISKTLIPEKHLGKGKSPLDHVIRNWNKVGERDAREGKEMAGIGAAIPFLAGPPTDGKEMAAVEIEGPLGKLSCRGVTGSLDVGTNRSTIRYDFENRLHETAPFGVVAAVWKFEINDKTGQIVATGATTLTLVDVDSKATSELPDNN